MLDLFAGCGGFSLGAQLAGAEILGGVEIDPLAIKTHAINFHRDDGARAIYSTPMDISLLDPAHLLKELRPALEPLTVVDVLVGGPPCQAFARVGRAKLREIQSHPEAFLRDERSQLFRHYLEFVDALAPVAVVVENVPDVLNYGGLNIFELMCQALEGMGYECRYGLLNAVHYGVPQMRERAFLIALRREVGVTPFLPAPTHSWTLPRGYQGSRDVALRGITLFDTSHYLNPPRPRQSLPKAVSAQDALRDLPVLTGHLRGESKRGARRFDSPVPLVARGGTYARLMREWPGFESDGTVSDHVIRHLPRDYRIFAAMKPGDQYPQAHAAASMLRDQAGRHLSRRLKRGLTAREWATLTAEYVPPYDPGKFPNKWRKMEADAPARTLMAHLGKDSYSHIHYDDAQARTISVREAARLQSFPDGFGFAGTMNPAFRQIGNAVPPLLANAVFVAALEAVGCSSRALRQEAV